MKWIKQLWLSGDSISPGIPVRQLSQVTASWGMWWEVDGGYGEGVRPGPWSGALGHDWKDKIPDPSSWNKFPLQGDWKLS